jgi:hypothetical protein
MILDDFWQLISTTISPEALEEADLSKLEAALAGMSAEEIASFNEHFSMLHATSYGWPIWGAAYIINGGCSDDGFDYFRGWLIGKGREAFEAAMADPDSLVDYAEDEVECEDLLSVAWQAYKDKTSEDRLPATSHSFPELGESWDFDDEAEMRKRYPRLCEKFFSA